MINVPYFNPPVSMQTGNETTIGLGNIAIPKPELRRMTIKFRMKMGGKKFRDVATHGGKLRGWWSRPEEKC